MSATMILILNKPFWLSGSHFLENGSSRALLYCLRIESMCEMESTVPGVCLSVCLLTFWYRSAVCLAHKPFSDHCFLFLTLFLYSTHRQTLDNLFPGPCLSLESVLHRSRVVYILNTEDAGSSWATVRPRLNNSHKKNFTRMDIFI